MEMIESLTGVLVLTDDCPKFANHGTVTGNQIHRAVQINILQMVGETNIDMEA
jgi:hypothetical protein